MTDEEIEKLILDIISDVNPDAELENISKEENLRDQLGLDSMDFLDIIMELRKRHSLEVPQEDYPKLATLQSCVEYLGPKLS